MKKINLKNSIILSICFCIFGVNVYASDNEWEFTNPEQEGVNSSILKKLSEEFNNYSWEKNFGYGTKAHMDALKKFGITSHHRKGFKPIHKMLSS